MTTFILRAVTAAAVLTSATAAFAAQQVRAPQMGDYQAMYDSTPKAPQNLGGMPDVSRIQVYVLGQGLEWKTVVSPKTTL
jgi:hypothetical protein